MLSNQTRPFWEGLGLSGEGLGLSGEGLGLSGEGLGLSGEALTRVFTTRFYNTNDKTKNKTTTSHPPALVVLKYFVIFCFLLKATASPMPIDHKFQLYVLPRDSADGAGQRTIEPIF